MTAPVALQQLPQSIWSHQRGFFIDSLLVRIHCIIVMIRWTGLAPWVFEFPFPGSLTSTLISGLATFVTSRLFSVVSACGDQSAHAVSGLCARVGQS